MRTNYPTPGQAPVADGISLRITGDEEMRKRLLELGVAIPNRLQGLLDYVGSTIAVAANAEAHRSRRRFKGRPGGFLARSFGVYDRTRIWAKYGLLGVAVRSRAKYHWFQEFGVAAGERQVVLHRFGATGKRVPRGQGEGRRYRDGTGRLNPGVSVSTYRRRINIPQHAVLGPVFARMQARAFADLEGGALRYIERMAAGAA